jgi:hypothetical protein
MQTMVDRIAVSSSRQRRQLPLFQSCCFVLIEASRFAASSLLIVLGLPLFAFLLLTGWDMGLLFAQLSNLADHYRASDAIRRVAFGQDLQIAFIAALLGVLLLRAPRFVKRLQTTRMPAVVEEPGNG